MKKSFWSSLLWWKTNPEELEFEVNNYKTLNIAHSSRGLSFLCLIFVGVVNLFFNYYAKVDYFWFDSFIMVYLGYFIWRGHKWAIILAMLVWTYDKGDILFNAMAGNSYGQIHMTASNGFIQIIWWAFFMQIFYKAYKVECLRRKK